MSATRAKRPPRLCAHPQGCRLSPDGTPAKHRRNGWCDTHDQRMRKSGSLGPPGPSHYQKPRRRPDVAEETAENFLRLVPARTSRGHIVARKPQRCWVLWRDGERAVIPQKSIDAWMSRGWLVVGEREPSGRTEIVITQGARARARADIARRAANVARWHAQQNHKSAFAPRR